MRHPSTSLIRAQTTSYSLPGIPEAPGSSQLLETSITFGSLGSIICALPISNAALGDPIGEISSPLDLISWRARVDRSDSMIRALLVRIPSRNAPTTSSGRVGFFRFSELNGTISSEGKPDCCEPLALVFEAIGVPAALARSPDGFVGLDWATWSFLPESHPTWPSTAARVAVQMKRFMSWYFL